MTAHPELIRVGVVTYRVTSDEESYNAACIEKDQGSGFYGLTNHIRAHIVLRPSLELSVERLTLWHEVMHACLEVLAGAPDWSDGWLGAEREERAIRAFEHPTLQVLVDNPDLRAYLFGSAL